MQKKIVSVFSHFMIFETIRFVNFLYIWNLSRHNCFEKISRNMTKLTKHMFQNVSFWPQNINFWPLNVHLFLTSNSLFLTSKCTFLASNIRLCSAKHETQSFLIPKTGTKFSQKNCFNSIFNQIFNYVHEMHCLRFK